MLLDLPYRNKRYGWIPDLPDTRDFPYVQLTEVIPTIPSQIDLRQYCTPIENQGQIGCCTACALVGNLEFLKLKKLDKVMNFSRLFLYYNERLIRHTEKVDSGASLRDGIKSLVKLGDCLETLWPFTEKEVEVKPSENCYQNGLNYQINSYYRLQSLSEMKHNLSLGFPFVFGFAVYESFESENVTKTGIVPMPDPSERMVGGHAVLAVGFDDAKKSLIVRNSWGADWGMKGYFYMPYTYVTTKNLASDFWTIRGME
jgi:C1A family cysteine protease